MLHTQNSTIKTILGKQKKQKLTPLIRPGPTFLFWRFPLKDRSEKDAAMFPLRLLELGVLPAVTDQKNRLFPNPMLWIKQLAHRMALVLGIV